MEKQFTAPIEKIILAGFGVSRKLELIGGRDEISIFFFDLAEEIVQLGGGFQFQEILNRLAGFLEMGSVKVRESKVVAVVVGSGIDALGLFEERDGCCDFSGLSVEFTEIVISIVIFWLKCHGLFELDFGLIEFSGASEIGGVVCASFRGIRLEANGFFKVQARLSILRLGGVNEAEKFVDFETLRYFKHQLLQCSGGFGKMARIVIGDSGLKLAVQILILALPGLGPCHG